MAGRAVRGLVLVATSLAAFTATLDNTVVAVAVVDLQRDLAVGVSELQGVVTAYTVALAALLLTGGTLADVAGRRRVLAAGLVVFSGASAGCATAGSAGALVGWRAVQGAGAALVLPGALAVLAAAYPERAARARAVGLWAATGAAALVLGPVVGGLLVARYGWPSVFWVNLPLCAAVLLVLLVAPAGDPPERGRRLDPLGQLLAAAGLAAGTFAVVLAGRDGLGAPVVATGAAAVAALVAFGVVERRVRDPLLPPALLRDRRLSGALTGAFAASLAVFVLLVFLSLFLQLVQQRDPLPTALRLLPLTAGLVLVAPLAGRWAAARGPRTPAVAGLVVAAGALGALALLLSPDLGDAALAAALGVAGAGLGLATAPVVTASMDAVEGSRSGLAAAAVNVARELGGVVAVAGLGALVVARLGDDLTRRLLGSGVDAARVDVVVEALLAGAGTDRVLEVAQGGVPFEALLQLRAAAEASYVGSVRVALLGAALVLLASAGACGRSLRSAG
ncbi:MAG TPA: MFS transporter [Mycobacteriales bacterium]|nr:MFS transporter [Mycobacteriales bacterium]